MKITQENIATINPTVLFSDRDSYENFRRKLHEARRALHDATLYILMGTELEKSLRCSIMALNQIDIDD